MNRIFRILVLLPLLVGCSGAFTSAIADPSPEASTGAADDDSGPLKGDAGPGTDAMVSPEGAPQDAAPVDVTPEASPEASSEAGCSPMPPSWPTFTCPVGGVPGAIEIPEYFALSDGTQCSFQHTPAACRCTSTYNAACIAPVACAADASPSGYTTSSGVVFVDCQ